MSDFDWYRKASKHKEMEDWFEKRTKTHIDLVGEYCKKVYDLNPIHFKEILDRAKIHDKSKFKNPERDPYIWITWKYKVEKDGKKLEIPEDMKEDMNAVTNIHCKNNRHHPEFHTDQTGNLINMENRDKKPDVMVDATKMEDLDIAEMVCDWCAVSKERGSSPKDWADKNVNIRWKFNAHQKKLIYEFIDNIWE